MKNITVIGGGNMGFTYAASIYDSPLEAKIQILEKSKERIDAINSLNTIVAGDDYAVLRDSDIVFLAVKPQIAPDVFKSVKHLLHKDQLVVSIMAGTTIETIQQGLGLDKVVRAMPNLPAQVNLGTTTYVSSPEVSKDELEFIAAILASTGEIIPVASEDQLDRSIGVSGSGPGFVFYMMNAMEKAAHDLGFAPDEAKRMIAQTVEGSVKLYKENNISLEEWMGRVSSKGGTTIAGLNYFEEKKIAEEIKNGIAVCVARAFELGGK